MTEIIIRDEVSRERAVKFMWNLSHEKQWHVTITENKKRRSLPQNSLWHKWFDIIAKETGATQADTKGDLTEMFCPEVESKLKPGTFRRKGTSELTTAEGAEFTDRVYQLACEFNIWLLHPEDRGR